MLLAMTIVGRGKIQNCREHTDCFKVGNFEFRIMNFELYYIWQ